MPFRLQYFEAPKNESLPVLSEPPNGTRQSIFGPDFIFNEAGQVFYECCFCKGWIEGSPNEYRQNTLSGRLSGRKGIAYHCIRCGNEIHFEGMLS
jgi:hypothetical protein